MSNKSSLPLSLPQLLCCVMITVVFFAIGCGHAEKKMDTGPKQNVVIVGHRGAPGHVPEHTLYGYELAVKMGADYIEPDLVSTKDGVLVARHENEISGTTDALEKFPKLKKKKKVDGQLVEGVFIEDLTLKQVKTLRAKERLPFRDQKNNGKFEVPTFAEILKLRADLSLRERRVIGIAPELKHSTYFKSIGLPLEEKFVMALEKEGLNIIGAPVMVQSFEISNLKWLAKKKIDCELVQLIDEPEMSPYDQVKKMGKKAIKYKDMVTEEGMKEIKTYATWISPWKPYLIPVGEDKHLLEPTDFVNRAHRLGLKVVPYTFRNEEQYLSQDDDGNPVGEYLRFFKLGVDAVFSDYPDTAFAARKSYLKN